MLGYVTSVVSSHFQRWPGVPAALSITGALIIVLAVVTARLMHATRRAKPAGPGNEEPGRAARPPEPTQSAAEEPPGGDLPKAS
jgi:hypothetical protein